MSRSNKTAALLVTAAALAVSLAGCSLLPKEEGALKPPLVKPAQENYNTVKVTKGTIIKQINSVGSLESISTHHAQFTAQGGRIEKIAVHSGDKVKKGDLLVQLVMDGLDISLKEQELALERAKYAFRQTRNSAAEERRMAELQVEIEQLKYDRMLKQFNTKQLLSGIDGQVIFVEELKEGDIVEPYQTIVTVADPVKLRVALRVESSSELQGVEVGMQVEVKLNDSKTEGKVVQTPSSAPITMNKDLQDRYSKTVYIEVPKLPQGSEIGSQVDVVIVTKKRDNVLHIPRSGLRAYLGRNFVRILEGGSRIREADVEPGITSSTAVEILNGLEEGQEIILQ